MKSLKRKNISSVVAEYLCHSCGACIVACNSDSISFQETVGGYLFPRINEDTCNICGLCYKVCPGVHFGKILTAEIHDDPFVGNILSCTTGRATDDRVFRNSQSGGVTTALLAYLLETGQISAVIVATMNTASPPRGNVLLATCVDDLIAAQKSKYVPIPLLSAILRIRDIDGRVALVGLPCRMHGLNNLFDLFPELRPKVLLKIGLICDRFMTNASVDFLGRMATAEPIKHLIFRDKQSPSYPGNPVIETVEGEKFILKASVRMAIKDFFTPVRCRLCFDKLNVFADVTLGDPHGLKEIDRKGGETLIISRTSEGHKLVSEAEVAGAIVIRHADMQIAVEGQHIKMKRSQWVGYMRAQSELGGALPEYPEVVQIRAGNFNGSIKYHKTKLLRSIGLDNFSSRDELIRYMKIELNKKQLLRRLFLPVIISKQAVRKILALVRKVWVYESINYRN